MSLDTTQIGTMAADLMESLPNEAEGEIVAVGMVIVVDAGDATYSRYKVYPEGRWVALGLFHEALEIALDGEIVEEE